MARSKAAASAAPVKAEAAVSETATSVEAADAAPDVGAKVVKYKVREALDPNMVVTVKNGFHGMLVYKSKRTGERFEWEDFGSEQEMELGELKNARNSSKTFFVNNWFLFDDPAVIDYLGVGAYYKNALTYEDFGELFEKSPDEIEEIVAGLSVGQKKSVVYSAKKLIADGVIDSIKVIGALEKSLSVELIDR